MHPRVLAWKGGATCLLLILSVQAQRSPVDVASTEEMRELLTAAAQKKRSKDDSHTGPSACAEEDDDADRDPDDDTVKLSSGLHPQHQRVRRLRSSR